MADQIERSCFMWMKMSWALASNVGTPEIAYILIYDNIICIYWYTVDVHMYIYMHAYIHAYLLTCIHAYIHASMHTSVHTSIHTFHAYMHACMHTLIHWYIAYLEYRHTCIHTYVRIHTHIRQQVDSNSIIWGFVDISLLIFWVDWVDLGCTCRIPH